jgi:transposase
MAKTRKRYTREFKVEAVRLAVESGEPASKIAKELGIHPNTLKAWMDELKADPENAFPGKGRMKPEADEVHRLRREVARLRQELEFLKKTAAYFAKQSR